MLIQYGDTILVSEGVSYTYILAEGGIDTILRYRTKRWFLCVDMCVWMHVCACVTACVNLRVMYA